MEGCLGEFCPTSYAIFCFFLASEWSEIEGKLGTPLQIAGGCIDRCVSMSSQENTIEECVNLCSCSYSDAIDLYMEEEEVRYLLPLKEYVAYCDSLR